MRTRWIQVAVLIAAWMMAATAIAEDKPFAPPPPGAAPSAPPATPAAAPTKTAEDAADAATTNGGGLALPPIGAAPAGAASAPPPAASLAAPAIAPAAKKASSSGEKEDILPLKFSMPGYYRFRYNWIGNAPLSTVGGPGSKQPNANVSYGYMRLRLEPTIKYGPKEDLPIAALKVQIDGFDNVVLGDNARANQTPILATEQSLTDIDGRDLADSLKLNRAWIEFLIPFGQIRVGRMPSHWGVGLLTHSGNGDTSTGVNLAEWGDFLRGETFDRILFITRPITIYNALTTGNLNKTPLIYGFVYDRLAQDTVVDATVRPIPSTTPGFVDPSDPSQGILAPTFGPGFSTLPERSTAPLQYLAGKNNRVNEIVNALAWWDEEFGRAPTDELFAGLYVVYRFQDSTRTRIQIYDTAWRIKYTLKDSDLAFTTAGEYYTIQGHSGALPFTRPSVCPPSPCTKGTANIHNVLGRIGIMNEGEWAAQLEGGFSSGDKALLAGDVSDINKLTARAFNQNVKVGLLMYQVALRSISYDSLAGLGADALGANGSVFNSKYLMPSYRFTIVNGLEAHMQYLVGWAHRLDPQVYNVPQVSKCGLKGKCFLGQELDVALRARMGNNDIVWVDLEGGIMQVGDALKNAGMQGDILWTVQLRSAMVF